jgi:hypothetical protein
VVWTDNRNGNERESEVYAARVTANGVPIDDRGIPVAHTTLLEHEPTVTWTGTEWLMAWTREDATNAGISAATVSTTGVATDLGVVAGTFGRESEAALASDGAGGALLVYQWNDHIRAQRYSGGAFAPFFNVAATPDLEAHPTVVHSAGGNYLVAWENGATPGQDVFARRIVPSGTNPPAFSVSEAPNSLSHLSSAFDGTNYILAWRRGGDIWGARISTAGAVLDTTGAIGGIALSANANVQADPSIGCSTTQCVLAWGDARDNSDPGDVAYDLIAQRFDFNLAPVGGEITVANLVRNQDEPSVTSTANGAFVVTWTDARTGVPAVFATRITSTGGVTRNGTLVNTALRNAQNRGAYAIGTTTALAVWSDSRNFGDDIMARRYSPTGARLDPDSLVVSNAQFDQASPAVAFDGAQYVSVWRDARNPNSDIFAARMQEDGTLSDPGGVEVSTAAAGQISPDIASDGAGVSLVAWQDRRNAATSGSDIMAAVMVDGAVTVSDIEVCATTDEQVNAAVTFDPNSGLFVVAWSDRRNAGSSDIYAARVAIDGTVLDPCGVPISAETTNWQQIPSLAVSGNQILVVWEDYRNDFFGDIWGGRITVDLTGITRLDGDGVPIAEGASWQVTPTTIGVGNGNWGIAWSDNVDELTSGSDIHGNTMAADGTLSIEPEYVISNGVYYESAPRFQSGPGGSTVALMYEYDHPSVGVLRVRRRIITY